MKILKLRFKNLNSLVGEWSIDFAAPGYLSDGIFAISGPTGSGKSTILDAICLALYGSTPRLGKITKTTNEIMSRQTGECSAEVVFQVNENSYICHWSQQRARKKANANLQEPKHEISDVITGNILADKLTEVKEVVEERTGMDFNRFTQSMLLAQGGFAVFLRATPDERAPILEQITGTEIYSDISKHVFERQKTEKELLDRLAAEIRGIVLMSDDEVVLLEQELTESHENAASLSDQKAGLEGSIQWLDGIEKLKSELAGIADEERKHATALAAFDPQRDILHNGLKAASMDGEFATLTGLRNLQNDELNKLRNSERKLPDSELKLQTSLDHLNYCTESHRLVNLGKESETQLLKIVREKDHTLSLKIADLKTARLKLGETEKEASVERLKKQDFENSLKRVNDELSGIKEYLLRNQTDALLVSELAGVKEQIRNLKEDRARYVQAAVNARDAEGKMTAQNHRVELQEKIRNELQGKCVVVADLISRNREMLNRLLGGRSMSSIRSEIGSLWVEMAKLQKIENLESERKQLADHVPCPLCGSLHHPWAEENVPGKSETEKMLHELTGLAGEAENLERELNDHLSKEREASDELAKVENSLSLFRQNLKALEQKRTECLDLERNSETSVSQRSASLLQTIAPLGINEIPDDNLLLDRLYNGLEKRKKNLEQNLERKNSIEGQINGLQNTITGSEAKLESLNNTTADQCKEISAKTAEIAELNKIRQEIYGDKNTEEEERKIYARVKDAENTLAAANKIFNQYNMDLNSLRTGIEALKSDTEARSGVLQIKESDFINSLHLTGFADEVHFTECRLSKEDTERLTREENRLDSQKADIEIRKKDRGKRFNEEKAKEITTSDLAELNSDLQKISKELVTVIKNTGALTEKRDANNQARAKNLQLKAKIDVQKSVYNKWFSLHALIGSADGKKFRNFAQGLTFELMVSHANRQLSKMSDRYLLIRDENQPLELNVIDNYQAGEIRTTKNLSGGESFIVSLALALGLSQMSSRKVRVDSLFLDEGFGTLDEDALDTALETLASLRQDGKLIGVISHVAAFKDRINTKILVQPVKGGKSIISGPGVISG